MRPLILILILVFIGLQYKLWLGDGNISQWRKLELALTQQKSENTRLSLRNTVMEADVIELKKGSSALEEQARYELGMVKDDEVYYQFVD